jgi:hypothetical protein
VSCTAKSSGSSTIFEISNERGLVMVVKSTNMPLKGSRGGRDQRPHNMRGKINRFLCRVTFCLADSQGRNQAGRHTSILRASTYMEHATRRNVVFAP